MNKFFKYLTIIVILSINFTLSAVPMKDGEIVWHGEFFQPNKIEVKKINPKSPFWIPYLEALSANLLLGFYNQYIMDEDFAQIDIYTIKKNFENGWEWDIDGLYTNMYLHPFQGSIYFNAGRSNGYDYWESMLVTLFGSLQWELFMENQPPSINDLIMTTLAGSLFGEVFYRVSSLYIDERKRNWKRLLREGVTAPYNPGRFVNRVLRGRAFREIPNRVYKLDPYLWEISLGVNNVGDKTDLINGNRYSLGKFSFIAGVPFFKKNYKPLDYFTVDIEYQNFDITFFRLDGILYGKRFDISEKHKMILGIFQYSDYIKTEIYQVGGFTVAPGITYSYFSGLNNIFLLMLKAGFMPMGGANSDYASQFIVNTFNEGRDYNMGYGFSSKFLLMWNLSKWAFRLRYNYWRIYTLTGAPGVEKVGMLLPSLRYFLYKNLYLSAQYMIYHRIGEYDDFDDIDLINFEERLTIGFIF